MLSVLNELFYFIQWTQYPDKNYPLLENARNKSTSVIKRLLPTVFTVTPSLSYIVLPIVVGSTHTHTHTHTHNMKRVGVKH